VIDGELLRFSENFACVDCGVGLPELSPRMFSFNNPYGACPDCMGLGSHLEFDEELVIPDKKLTVEQGVFAPLSKNPASYAMCALKAVLESRGYDKNAFVRFRRRAFSVPLFQYVRRKQALRRSL